MRDGLFSRCLYWACRTIGRVLVKLLFRGEALGRESIPRRGRVIFASNHRSYLDPVLAGIVIPRPVHFAAKVELFSNCLFGWFIRQVHAFPVRRSGVDREMLRWATRLFDAEQALLMFPEGTRGKGDEFLAPKSGVGFLSVRSGAPIVPTYIHNSERILPPGASMIRPHKLYVCFGEPIDPPQPSETHVTSEVYSDLAIQVMESIKQLKGDLLRRIRPETKDSAEETSD